MSLTSVEEQPPEGFEQLIRVEDPEAGLKGFICIHSTACGPAAGGCRVWNYRTLDEARTDALRLASGMTYKNAIAGVELGGGKSVIWADARSEKSEALLRSFGRAVDALAGRYYTAEDVGMSADDMAVIAQETPYAVGLEGGEFGSGDPSPFTAEGVFQCLRAGAAHVFGSDDLSGRTVLVQGLGHVGMSLTEKLAAAGADLIVTDISQDALTSAQAQFGARICPPEDVFAQQMDIFAPCALGGILTQDTVAQLTARMVCGAANNQLAQPEIAAQLQARDIAYLPDYIVNSGGIISVASEIHRRGSAYREARLSQIAGRMTEILRLSQRSGQTTSAIAAQMANEIIAQSSSALAETRNSA